MSDSDYEEKTVEDFLSDEDRDAIHNDKLDDDEYESVMSDAQLRLEEYEEEADSDPYSDDEKEQMGSQEFFDDNG